MIVYYRLTDIESTNPPPVWEGDKYRLNRMCLRSFVEAYKDIKPHMVFICDFCPPEYKDMIEELVPFKKDILFTQMGINETCLHQYKLYNRETDSTVLFAECDYYWIKPLTPIQIELLELVSPYDHPDFYTRPDIHEQSYAQVIVNKEVFRTATRNTMTFAMSREAFEKNLLILNKWGYLDNEVWHEMRENGYTLHTPKPSYATHMVRDYLAPDIDWNNLWKTQI